MFFLFFFLGSEERKKFFIFLCFHRRMKNEYINISLMRKFIDVKVEEGTSKRRGRAALLLDKRGKKAAENVRENKKKSMKSVSFDE